MVYQPKSPMGYKSLITWRQAGEIYRRTKVFTKSCLDRFTDRRLIDHMNDSARSVQRNIEEGYKRASTVEYVKFLGFSRASLEELKGDFEELKREWREGLRWVNRGKEGGRDKGAEIGGGEGRDRGRASEDIEKLAIAREINEMLDLVYGEDCMMGRQIMRLEEKMVREKTLPKNEMLRNTVRKAASEDRRFWELAAERFGVKKPETNRG